MLPTPPVFQTPKSGFGASVSPVTVSADARSPPVGPAGKCMTPKNDYSSKSAMEVDGWIFDWDQVDKTFMAAGIPDRVSYCVGVPDASYCGYKSSGNAAVQAVLCAGEYSLDFGNPHSSGTVVASLNGATVATASGRTPSRVVHFVVARNNTVLKLSESNGVIAINSLTQGGVPRVRDVCPPGGSWRRWFSCSLLQRSSRPPAAHDCRRFAHRPAIG